MKNEQLNLTESQKEAAVYALYQIAMNDGINAESTIYSIRRVENALGQIFEDADFDSIIVKNVPEQVSSLESLNEFQKQWFIKSTMSILDTEVFSMDSGFSVTRGFFSAMNISKEDIYSIA